MSEYEDTRKRVEQLETQIAETQKKLDLAAARKAAADKRAKLERELDPTQAMNDWMRAATGKLPPEPEDEGAEAEQRQSWDGGPRQPAPPPFDGNQAMNDAIRRQAERSSE